MSPNPDHEFLIEIASGQSVGLFKVRDRVFDATAITPREALPLKPILTGAGALDDVQVSEGLAGVLNTRRLQLKNGKYVPGGPEITPDWMLDVPGRDQFRLLIFLTNPTRPVKDAEDAGGDLPN